MHGRVSEWVKGKKKEILWSLVDCIAVMLNLRDAWSMGNEMDDFNVGHH